MAHSQDTAAMDMPSRLRELVHHLEHVLPAQASIKDFVHHNTLHGYQHRPFHEAVAAARQLTGAAGYLPESRFREFHAQGRILDTDLDAALDSRADLDLDAELVPPPAGPIRRRDVLKAVLLHPFNPLSRSQLKWQLEEMQAASRFQADLPEAVRQGLLGRARAGEAETVADLWAACLEVLGLEHAVRHPEELLDLSPRQAEAMAARIAAETGIGVAAEEAEGLISRQLRKEAGKALDAQLQRLGGEWTLRALLRALTGEDILDDIRPLLARQFASHIDQGLAAWHNPDRARGFYAAWRESAARDLVWALDDLPEWRQYAERLPEDPLQTVIQELRLTGLPEDLWPGYLERLALELPGWSGMALWRHGHPGYAGQTTPVAMMDYLAVYLVLERLFAQRLCRRHWRAEASVPGIRSHFRHSAAELYVRQALFEGRLPEYLGDYAERLVRESVHRSAGVAIAEWEAVARLIWGWRQTPAADRREGVSVAGTGWQLFRLAQHLGLTGRDVRALGRPGVDGLLACLTLLDFDAAGHVWLLAYERRYREQIFAALAANHGRGTWAKRDAAIDAQIVWCMDDREEGIRRHLEELNPRIETLGAAAHFSVFMNWWGLGATEPEGLCPVVAKPAHAVTEAPRADAQAAAASQAARKRLRLGARERLLQGTRRGALGAGLLSAAAAPVAALTLLGKALVPGALGRFNEALRSGIEGTVPTRIAFTAPADSAPGTVEANRPGFADTEQADRVQAFLRNIGLTYGFAPIVTIMGHGSNSLNNPHMAAYDCGACSGRHSGPNARVFAAMANRPEVRAILAERGLAIPADTWFMGAEHNTCDDVITWYDTDLVPEALRPAFDKLKAEIDEAALKHMQERCRRFASAPDKPGPAAAWRHIQGRRWDYSQARPELGHATNACAFIGRRSMSRGAFFDRRSFLISYDPTQDAEGKVLEGLLLANGPVGAGISLEYYFSTVDNERYGCGTKAVHNVTGYFGVMEGASSDLRTGLPRQMIEIHEAMRLLVVVEHKIDVVTEIYKRQPPLQELIGGGWLIVAAKDPDSAAIHLFDPARGWLPWEGEADLPKVETSFDWFEGHRAPLPPALLTRPVSEERA